MERMEGGERLWVKMRVLDRGGRRGITDLEVQAWLVMFIDLGSI